MTRCEFRPALAMSAYNGAGLTETANRKSAGFKSARRVLISR